jgi:hypothetical protein
MKFVSYGAALALIFCLGSAAAATPADGKGDRVRGAPPPAGQANAKSSGPIQYGGGGVLTEKTGVNVYYIWYGNWTGNTGPQILTDFMNNLGGSPYFGINTTYYDANNVHVKNKVNLISQVADNYSQGTRLSDNAVLNVVSNAITGGGLPLDTNGVYFVLTSQDVNESGGFCLLYCGWHNHASVLGADIKYSFVGNAARCLKSCAAQSIGPNDNAGADAMASTIAHELEEAVTDPDLDAWKFSNGQENADACAWTFGSEYVAANGANANMKLGNRDFLIQQNWVNQKKKGGCALSL